MATCPKCNAEIESLVFVTIFEQDVFLKTLKADTKLIRDTAQRVKHRYECPLCGKSVGNLLAEADAVLKGSM